jgi:hypothetical protein
VPITDFAHQRLRSSRRRDVPVAGLVVAGIVAVLVLMRTALREPDHVDRLTLANPTDYGVNVTVRSAPEEGRFSLGWAEATEERVLREVPDLGDTWIFGFSYAGVDAGELAVTRDALASGDWRLEIPASIAERIAAAGLTPAYRDPSVGDE